MLHVLKGQSDPQLTGQLVSFYNRMKDLSAAKGKEIRGGNIVNKHSSGFEVMTTGYGKVYTDPIQGSYILHPEMTNLTREDKDELIALINPSLTEVTDFVPTPEEEI